MNGWNKRRVCVCVYIWGTGRIQDLSCMPLYFFCLVNSEKLERNEQEKKDAMTRR